MTPHRRRRTVAAATAAVLVIAAAVVVMVVHDGPRAGSAAASHAPVDAPWATYRVPEYGFTVQHPENWVPSDPERPNPGGADEPVATLGTVRLVTACHATGGGTSCAPAAQRRLHAGDVVERWTFTSGPLLAGISAGAVRAHGTPTRIGGHDAWVRLTRGRPTGTCRIVLGSTSGGTGQVDVSIELSKQRSLDLSACIAGSTQQLARLQKQVLRSARSVLVRA